MRAVIVLLVTSICFLTSCSTGCDENQANNKMLALNKFQSRLIATGGDATTNYAISLTKDIGAVTELIALKKFAEACQKADEVASINKIDFAAEQKDMISYEQLVKDGGKGAGECSIADAARRQMELHSQLQAEVDAGRMSSEIFRVFGEDTKGYAELLSTDPSAACKLFDTLKRKYFPK